MFASLDEQMRHDDEAAITARERVTKWVFIVVSAVVLFGTLYAGIHLLT
jgi:hypothetical protein